MGTITVKDGISLAGTDGKLVGTTALNDTSGNEVAATFNYTTNKDAGNDTGLLISMTDTKSEGTSLLIDAQVGAASKFYVKNNGATYFGSADVVISPAVGGYMTVANVAEASVQPIYAGRILSGGTNCGISSIFAGYGAAPEAAITSTGSGAGYVGLGSAVTINWDSAPTYDHSGQDTGLARSAAGVVKVTDGSTGTGSLVASSAITAVGTAAYNGVIRTGVYKRAWTNAEVVGLGASKDVQLKIATLPAKTIVRNAYVVVDTRETALAGVRLWFYGLHNVYDHGLRGGIQNSPLRYFHRDLGPGNDGAGYVQRLAPGAARLFELLLMGYGCDDPGVHRHRPGED